MPALGAQNLALIWIVVGVAQAYTVFYPHCSEPEKPANFVGSPDSRGTLDILWSSLFTIFACTWSIQHLNVPEQREGRDPGWRGDFKWMLKGIWSKSKWMLITVIAPELVFSLAVVELSDARALQLSMRHFVEQDGVEWTLTHCMFANMGGFVLRSGTAVASEMREHFSNTEMQGSLPSGSIASSARIGNSGAPTDRINNRAVEETMVTHSRDQAVSNEGEIPVLDSIVESDPGVPQTVSTVTEIMTEAQPDVFSGPKLYHLDARQILTLRSEGQLKKLPCITKGEVNDKSKGDSFTKAIAVGQISWTVIQVCVRGARGLAISQLEIAVIAFSFCAAVIYAVQWLRPKDVGVPITVVQYEGSIPSEVLNSLHKNGWDRERYGKNIPNYKPEFSIDEHTSIAALGLIMGSVIFGAPHIGAWNFEFPTQVEQYIWRVSSIYCTCIVIPTFIVAAVINAAESAFPQLDLEDNIYLILAIAYILGRLFILVEILRTLCFLPTNAYTSTWASDIPHIG